MPTHDYRLKNGDRVPGVTTICGILDKPALLDWAWRLGKEGKDWREERDNAGDIGTLAHESIMMFLNDQPGYLRDRPTVVVKCWYKFIDWWVNEPMNRNEGIVVEQPFISERYDFGGTPDIFLASHNRLIDIKTSNGIYESHWLQLAGYGILLKENGYKVDEYQILWLPKDDRFGTPIRTDLRKEKRIFKHLLEVYKLRRE